MIAKYWFSSSLGQDSDFLALRLDSCFLGPGVVLMRLRVGHVYTFLVLEPTKGTQPLSIYVFLLGRRQMFIYLSIHLLIPQVFMEPS